MALTENEKLVTALKMAAKVADGNIVKSSDIPAKSKTLLVKQGYLKTIIKGWYLFDADVSTSEAGDSALWYNSMWDFIGKYLGDSYGTDYWLNPEASIDLHTASNAIPKQLIAFTNAGSQRSITMPNGMSLMVIPTKKVYSNIVKVGVVRALGVEAALASLAPSFYRTDPIPVEIALNKADVNKVAEALIETKALSSAQRVLGAYKEAGLKVEFRKLKIMIEGAVFQSVTPVNPFQIPLIGLRDLRTESPAAIRVRMLWKVLRDDVERAFTGVARQNFFSQDIKVITSGMDNVYKSDAYHSLSIEGYVVSAELIERVASGDWNTEIIEADKKHRDALAARGYYEAFIKLKGLLEEAYSEGEDDLDLNYLIQVGVTEIYTALFAPCVTAGIVQAQDLAGYRKGAITIRGSRHMPPQSESLMDCMTTLIELITDEPNFAVKATLGHLLLGYIHPFPDGNGRTSRFIMNLLFTIGGYRWTVVPVTRRADYLSALEEASTNKNVSEFASFLVDLMPETYGSSPSL
ncbi:Fic family protein [Vibrio chagasii]|nr:Fic family protein [Vibrio chagasii]